MPEQMTLSLLRARIRAGGYADDQYAEPERRLLFLRWLVEQGWVNEWQMAEEAPAQPLNPRCYETQA